MSIKNNTASLQSLLEMVNNLPDAGDVELPELTNEGTASDLLSGKQLINGNGNVVTGTIQTKTASDLTVSGSTITVPPGYYASGAIQSVHIAQRANTTMSTTVDDTNDKITITASNNQEAGYVTASNKTATKVISLSASGATVTASDGTNKVSKSVSTATQATPNISVDANGKITANSTQTAGYVQAGTKSATKQLTTQAAKTITPTTTNQTIAAGTYLTGVQTIKGDSNLKAENIKSGVSIFGVNGTLESGSISSEEQEDAFITKAIGGSYFNDRVTTIGGGVFAGCKSLIAVNFPACITIDCASVVGNYPLIGAFQYCAGLKTANFPVCTSVNMYAFYRCSGLTTVSFPACTYIGSFAFYDCESLTAVSFPACTRIDNSAFQDCKSLTTVSFPACTRIDNSAFQDCKSLTTANFPVCTSVNMYAFYRCSGLTTASFPACTYIGFSAFASCENLTTVSFPTCTRIDNGVFYKCYNLKSLYLTGSSLCQLSSSNVFTSTPIGGYSASAKTYGSIYVPASLLTSYQTATNWTYFSSRFVAYNPIITFTIDGTSYQAEEGMTWAEWVKSEYAINESNNHFYINAQNEVITTSGTTKINGVSASDNIIKGTNYISTVIEGGW